jgi:hypothetical protein
MENNELTPDFDFSNIGIDATEIQLEAENQIKATSSNIDKLIIESKIDLSKQLQPPPVAMKIKHNEHDITLFTKGNFSIVTGKAKSRKSFVLSMLMATAIKGSFQDHFFCPSNGVNILFDTEQSEYKVMQVSKRIIHLSETPNPTNFEVYHLRTLDPLERLNVIDKVLSSTKNLNFVAIDGIVDLDIDPILQAEQAQNIISKLMKWTDNYNIHIVCVLHYNKTVSTLLGHLGSFAHRKADSVIEVVKDTENENISFVNPVDCREREFLPFAFSVDDNGIPKIESEIVIGKSKASPKAERPTRPKAITPIQLDLKIHTEILNETFRVFNELSYTELWKTLKQTVSSICKDEVKDTIGDNKAKDFVTYYLQNQMIVKITVEKKQLYTLNEQKELDLL